jgi:hypothetical protein
MVSLAESSIVIYLWTIPLNSLLLDRARQRPRSKTQPQGRDAAANRFSVSSRGQPPSIRCG